MARILEDFVENKIACPHCHRTIGYNEKDDVYMGEGGKGIDCPGCNGWILLEAMDEDKWPDAFYHYGDGVVIEDEEIQKWVHLAIQNLVNEPESNYYYTGSGNTLVCAFWDDDAINIYVCQNYYNAYITNDFWHDKYILGKK